MIEEAGRPQADSMMSARPISGGTQGFTGTINLHLNDLIQMVCLSRSDLTIRVKSTHGKGNILVKEGEIQHAGTDSLTGEAAFFEIMRWRDGQFEMSVAHEFCARSIHKPWEHLLLEAMRRRDEDTAEQHRAVMAEFEESCLDDLQDDASEDIDKELDGVFDELAKASREFTQDELEAIEESPEEELPAFEQAPAQERPVRVLIVDDSPFFSRQLKRMLEQDPNIQVVATARNGKEALEFLDDKPQVDVITLDVEMPIMQGDTALKHIMIRHPIPVVTISSLQSESLLKIFEFLQAGAVDFFPKPGAATNLTGYGEQLRDLVVKASKAEIGHFKRWRRQRLEIQPAEDAKDNAAEPLDRILVVVGAEGAYMDWFRLPLQRLCSRGIVLGLQKIAPPFLPRFCQLIEDATGTSVNPLVQSANLGAGSFFLANPCRSVKFALDQDEMALVVSIQHSREMTWSQALTHWIPTLAEVAGRRLSLFCLSAATAIAPQWVNRIIECGTQIILSHRSNVMCADLIDSFHPYELLFPKQVTWGTPEGLLEVWLKNAPLS